MMTIFCILGLQKGLSGFNKKNKAFGISVQVATEIIQIVLLVSTIVFCKLTGKR